MVDKREYERNYYTKHKDKMQPQKRAQAKKHASKRSKYAKGYYQKHKTEIIKKTSDYQREHPKLNKQKHDKWRDKLKTQVREILGVICVICGKTEKIVYHEKRGYSHAKEGYLSQNPKYILDNIQNFVPICRYCHVTLHILIKRNVNIEYYLKYIWDFEINI